jgi:AraC-like DNA-binding protein/mannose-6-phosphate isomerase-like protein (cupin superfamily)
VSARSIIGAALEFNGGEPVNKTCYRTYQGAMRDQSFRFNIAVVGLSESFKMHSHEYSELMIVLGGRARHLTDYGSHPLETGDVAVINGSMRHGYEDVQNLKLCLIMYDPRQFLGANRDLNQMAGYHALFGSEAPGETPGAFHQRLHLPAEEMVYVTSLLSALQSEFEGRAGGRQTAIRNTFLLLVTCLSRLYERSESGTPLVRMANVMAHIRHHFREPLALEELARLAHVSVSQFQRNFKRVYHTTPIHFITRVRVHEACELLKDPNQDITNIALETGFGSSSFFATQFKRYMGESPSQYRRKKLAELPVAGFRGEEGRANAVLFGLAASAWSGTSWVNLTALL